ncbi:unnamed protein product, partial [Allacma fusca]
MEECDKDIDFTVVHFIETNEVELVPTKWIKQESKELCCFWPEFRNVAKINAAIKGLKSPGKSDWKTYSARVMHQFRYFEEGKQNIGHFEEFSELNGNETRSAKQKSRTGRVVTKRKLEFVDESSDEDAAKIPTKFQLGPANPPAFPVVDITSGNMEETISTGNILKPIQPTPSRSSGISGIKNIHGRRASPLSQPAEPENMPTNFVSLFADFQKDVFIRLATIQATQNTMQTALFSLVNNARIQNTNCNPQPQNQIAFNFPFKTKEGLMDFDLKLKNENAFKQAARSYLGSLGGSDLTEIVYKVLKELLTYPLAYHYNYIGVRGKSNFSVLEIND